MVPDHARRASEVIAGLCTEVQSLVIAGSDYETLHLCTSELGRLTNAPTNCAALDRINTS